MNWILKGVLVLFISTSISSELEAHDIPKIDFRKADSVAAHWHRYPIQNLRELSIKLTTGLATDLEKYRSIFKWVCDNIENDYQLFLQNKKVRSKYYDQPDKLNEWNTRLHRKSFHRLVTEYKTLCSGYAYMVKELAYHAGLEASIVNGYGRATLSMNKNVPNHSWNAVKIDGIWYISDPTWASGSIHPEGFRHEFNEVYFLMKPELAIWNHYPLESKWMFVDDVPTLEEFLGWPLLYKKALIEGIIPISPMQIKTRSRTNREEITFQISSSEEIKSLNLNIVHKGYNTRHKPSIERDKLGYRFSQSFDMTGIYNVNIKMGEEYLISYEVQVGRMK